MRTRPVGDRSAGRADKGTDKLDARTSRPRPTRVLVPSIVRSISWGFWWRRVLAMVCLDLALVISLLMV